MEAIFILMPEWQVILFCTLSLIGGLVFMRSCEIIETKNKLNKVFSICFVLGTISSIALACSFAAFDFFAGKFLVSVIVAIVLLYLIIMALGIANKYAITFVTTGISIGWFGGLGAKTDNWIMLFIAIFLMGIGIIISHQVIKQISTKQA